MSARDKKDYESSFLPEAAQTDSLRSLKIVLLVVLAAGSLLLIVILINNMRASANPQAGSQTAGEANASSPAEQVAPTRIDIVQGTDGLIARSNDQSITDWQYIGPQSVTTGCNSSLFTALSAQIRFGPTVDLEPADYGSSYCFRGLSSRNGQYVYEGYTVIDSVPLINLVQFRENDRLGLQAFSTQEIVAWQWLGDLPEATCDAVVFSTANPTEINSSQEAVLTVNGIETDTHYCFRAENETGGWGYKHYFFTPEAAE